MALFHGDDKVTDEYAFRDYARILSNKDIDGLYSDIVVMNSKSVITRKLKVVRKIDARTLVVLLGRAGSNVILDPFFVKKLKCPRKLNR